ncbi:LON peptidase substrate-binding domain-containing protein [Bradyrhizobium sp.]|uniref:LON peptidase substrate-binding domain-containing protein n=1 Tax=Bradyrhizobium sp. TaxID=376 RepID=UPI003C67A3F5
MRSFRDAKTMAQTLRDSLTGKAVTISHSESLELVSKMLGAADWNTLSALIQASRQEPAASAAQQTERLPSYPAMPLRDLVPFPTAIYPLFVGRQKTMQALDQAFHRQREMVLAVQKDSAVDEPGLDDIYDVGVLAGLIELYPQSDGTLKVLTQIYRRVMIRRFLAETGTYVADITDLSEGPIPAAPELIEQAVARFKIYAKAWAIQLPQTHPPLEQIRDPGRVADIICAQVKLPIRDKQGLLATLDPVARLERVHALMQMTS